MSDFKITRRDLVASLVGGVTAGLLGSYWSKFEDDTTLFDIELPTSFDREKPPFEVFLALSKLVTVRTSLDIDAAKRMYPIFMDEPWGSQHIVSSYTQILSLIDLPSHTTPPFTSLVRGKLGKGESWFTSHLLTTWYLGIYYHEARPPVRVTYESALMFDSIRGVLPVPLLESTGYGGWTEPPAGSKRYK